MHIIPVTFSGLLITDFNCLCTLLQRNQILLKLFLVFFYANSSNTWIYINICIQIFVYHTTNLDFQTIEFGDVNKIW